MSEMNSFNERRELSNMRLPNMRFKSLAQIEECAFPTSDLSLVSGVKQLTPNSLPSSTPHSAHRARHHNHPASAGANTTATTVGNLGCLLIDDAHTDASASPHNGTVFTAATGLHRLTHSGRGIRDATGFETQSTTGELEEMYIDGSSQDSLTVQLRPQPRMALLHSLEVGSFSPTNTTSIPTFENGGVTTSHISPDTTTRDRSAHCRLRTALLNPSFPLPISANDARALAPTRRLEPVNSLSNNRYLVVARNTKSAFRSSQTDPPSISVDDCPFLPQTSTDTGQNHSPTRSPSRPPSAHSTSSLGLFDVPSYTLSSLPPSATTGLRRIVSELSVDQVFCQPQSNSQPQSPELRPRRASLPVSPCRLPMKKRKFNWNNLNEQEDSLNSNHTNTTWSNYPASAPCSALGFVFPHSDSGETKALDFNPLPSDIPRSTIVSSSSQTPLVIDCPIAPSDVPQNKLCDSSFSSSPWLCASGMAKAAVLFEQGQQQRRPNSIPGLISSSTDPRGMELIATSSPGSMGCTVPTMDRLPPPPAPPRLNGMSRVLKNNSSYAQSTPTSGVPWKQCAKDITSTTADGSPKLSLLVRTLTNAYSPNKQHPIGHNPLHAQSHPDLSNRNGNGIDRPQQHRSNHQHNHNYTHRSQSSCGANGTVASSPSKLFTTGWETGHSVPVEDTSSSNLLTHGHNPGLTFTQGYHYSNPSTNGSQPPSLSVAQHEGSFPSIGELNGTHWSLPQRRSSMPVCSDGIEMMAIKNERTESPFRTLHHPQNGIESHQVINKTEASTTMPMTTGSAAIGETDLSQYAQILMMLSPTTSNSSNNSTTTTYSCSPFNSVKDHWSSPRVSSLTSSYSPSLSIQATNQIKRSNGSQFPLLLVSASSSAGAAALAAAAALATGAPPSSLVPVPVQLTAYPSNEAYSERMLQPDGEVRQAHRLMLSLCGTDPSRGSLNGDLGRFDSVTTPMVVNSLEASNLLGSHTPTVAHPTA